MTITKGPWNGEEDSTDIFGPDGRIVGWTNGFKDDEHAAIIALPELVEACELIVAVKHCMMFHYANSDWLVDEVLDRHNAEGANPMERVQNLAKRAEETANAALIKAGVMKTNVVAE